MSNASVIKYSMEKNEDSINANINFLLMNPLMFKIISQLSFKNAFKQKPDTTVNYDLSFLCLWLKNKDDFLYFDNTVDCKNKSESKNASYQDPREDSMLSEDDATKMSEESKIEEYLSSLCDSN